MVDTLVMYAVCLDTRNFFLKNGIKDIHAGTYTIADGTLSGADFLVEGQYFRIVGSKLNDGVYLNDAASLATLKNETWTGSVWDMSVPPAFLHDCEEIGAWLAKYGDIDNAAMSPYTSESFGGYSYSKAAANASSGTGSGGSGYQTVFAGTLNRWRRVHVI